MREMTDKEQIMFDLLKNDQECRNNNWQAVRQWYYKVHGVYLPKLEGLESVWTVERMIRTLKSTYPSQLTDEFSSHLKNEKELEYKEMALDENKPVLPQKEPLKEEQIELRWW